MPNPLFDPQGRYLIGKHRGSHASKLTSSFVEWAKTNVKGFKEQYPTALQAKPPVPKSTNRPTRNYRLDKEPRMYERCEPQDAMSFDEVHGQDLHPPTAFDLGADF